MTELENKPRLIVGSGWWCSADDPEKLFPRRKRLGDDEIRSAGFFDDWLKSVKASCTPDEIVVVDSNAPLKPDPEQRNDLIWITLPFNARHSTDHEGRWSGWTRSVIVSACYAMASEADYFVYVEQDCLLKGHQIVERCVRDAPTGLVFGSGEGTPQPLQQSFFIVRQDRLQGFIANLSCLKMADGDFSPEWKFVVASSALLTMLANIGLFRFKALRRLAVNWARHRCYNHLPIGYGRSRPMLFDDSHLYFQHGTTEELSKYRQQVGNT